MDANTVSLLQDVKFLRGLPPNYLLLLAERAVVEIYGKSEVIFREGQPAEGIYLVASGKIALELSPCTIYSKHLVDVEPGEMLGWSSLLEGHPFAATAIATEPSSVIRLDGERVREMCKSYPEFGYELMRRTTLALSKRLTATWAQLASLYVSRYLPVASASEMDS